MEGRYEHSERIKEKILLFLSKADEPFQSFYYYMSVKREPRTCKEYLGYVNNFIDFLKKQKTDFSYETISAFDVSEYVLSIQKNKQGTGKTSDSYQAVVWAAINLFFKSLIISRTINKNPCDFLDRPKVKDKPEIIQLNKNQIQQLYSTVETGTGSDKARKQQEGWKERDRLILTLLLETGMRVTALCEINVIDIDFDNCCIKVVEKGGIVVYKYFTKSTIPCIEAWLEKRELLLKGKECEALIISSHRKRITIQSIDNIIKKYASNLGLQISAHKLRSTYCGTIYDNTKDIYFAKECMGHQRIESTLRYIPENPEAKTLAAQMMSELNHE